MKNIAIIIVLLTIALPIFSYPIKTFDAHDPINTCSAKQAGLGGTQVAYTDDAFFNIYNPALLAFVKANKMGVTFRYMADKPEANIKNPSQVLQKASFSALNVTSNQNFAFFYKPIADEKKDVKNRFVDSHFDYNLSSVGVSMAEKKDNYSVGFNLQYLFGRVINNETVFADTTIASASYLDSRLKGFTTDLAFAFKQGNFTSGLVFYDLLSGLYKEKAGYSKLKQRWNYGGSYSTENATMLAGISSTLRLNDTKTYHFGYEQKLGDVNNNLTEFSVRAGFWGESFKNSDTVYTGYGTSFKYQSMGIDFTIVNHKWELKKNRYYLSFSFSAE